MFTRLFVIITAIALAGCASTDAEMKHSERMYDKQIAATKEAKPVPIFQMTARAGETIELKGVQQISVYNPSDATGKIPAFTAPLNANIEMAKIIVPAAERFGLGWLGTVLGITNATKGAADKDVAGAALTSITPVAPWATTAP